MGAPFLGAFVATLRNRLHVSCLRAVQLAMDEAENEDGSQQENRFKYSSNLPGGNL
jgi:hypothetical protein